VDEERTRPGYWLQLVFSVFFGAFISRLEWQEGQPAHRICFTNPRGSLLEQVEEEIQGRADPDSPGKTAVKRK